MDRSKKLLSVIAVLLTLLTGCGGGGSTTIDQQTAEVTTNETNTTTNTTTNEVVEVIDEQQPTTLTEMTSPEKSSRIFSDKDPVIIDANGSIQASSMDRIYEIIDLLGMVEDEEEAHDLLLELIKELLAA